MNGPHALLFDVAKILGVAAVLVLVLGRLRQPAVLGYLLAGVLVGPAGLGLISDLARIDQIAEVGVLLLMFAVGLESSLDRLRPVRRLAVLGGMLQVGLTVLLTCLVLRAIGWGWGRAIFLGCILAMSSTTIVMRSLHERGETDAPHGQVALGILIVQDLAVVPITIVLPTLVSGKEDVLGPALAAIGKGAVALAAALLLARFLIPSVFRQIARARSRELFSIAVLGLAVGTAVASEAAGLSLALGAFVAGLALGGTDYEHEARAIVAPLRDAFAGVFFASIGMLLDPVFVAMHPGDLALVVALVLVGNTLVTIAALLFLRAPLRVAVLVGVALSQVGEFSFLIAKMGHEGHIFQDEIYHMTVAASVATMLLTPFAIKLGGPIAAALAQVPFVARRASGGAIPEVAGAGLDRHALLCGYGPIGRDVAKGLSANDVPFVALELNPHTVERARAEGVSIFYADATQPEVLAHAGVARAKAVLVTVPDGLEILARALRSFDVPRGRIEQELEDARAGERRSGARGIKVAPKRLGEITRVLRQVQVEILEVESGSALDGATIEEGVRSGTGASVLAVLRGSETIANPPSEVALAALDRIVVFGSRAQVSIVEQLACVSRAPTTEAHGSNATDDALVLEERHPDASSLRGGETAAPPPPPVRT
ncbi:cation:proton antiporter [bacterium]|nr:cation:proton antiporter [bacterium]